MTRPDSGSISGTCRRETSGRHGSFLPSKVKRICRHVLLLVIFLNPCHIFLEKISLLSTPTPQHPSSSSVANFNCFFICVTCFCVSIDLSRKSLFPFPSAVLCVPDVLLFFHYFSNCIRTVLPNLHSDRNVSTRRVRLYLNYWLT